MPRKKRRCRSRSAPAVLRTPTKKKRKQYSQESLSAALDAVKDGMPVRRACVSFGVPRSTLQDRMNGWVTHGTNLGPKPYLAPAEEKELSQFLVDVANAGYGKTRSQVITIAQNVARDKGRITADKKVSHGWFRRFMERQPQLMSRKGDATANVRMDSVNATVIRQYLDHRLTLLDLVHVEREQKAEVMISTPINAVFVSEHTKTT